MARLFDENALLDNVGCDIEFLAETVVMLQTDGPVLLQQLRDALAAGDAAVVGKTAHTLKGMISNFCAAGVQAAAIEVEKMGKAGDLSAAPAAIDALAPLVETLIAELTAFVQEKK
jgi:two-component system, sensor histidine kinase and response regulator